jgi:hypothetical protein
VLTEEYGYTIQGKWCVLKEELGDFGPYMCTKSKTPLSLLDIDEQQKAFILAKEIVYNYLEITERLFTFSWIKFKNFDEVLNNFYASLSSRALLIPRKQLVSELIYSG